MSNTDPLTDALREMHLALVQDLLARIQSGEATASELNVARQMLKDNHIEAVPTQSNGLEHLGRILPFDPASIEPYTEEGMRHEGRG